MFRCVFSERKIWSAALREGGGFKSFKNWEKLQSEGLLSIFQVRTAVLLKGSVFWEFKLRFWEGIFRHFGVTIVTSFSWLSSRSLYTL
jgi:hypothetical protein